jgi:hypothetical protein
LLESEGVLEKQRAADKKLEQLVATGAWEEQAAAKAIAISEASLEAVQLEAVNLTLEVASAERADLARAEAAAVAREAATAAALHELNARLEKAVWAADNAADDAYLTQVKAWGDLESHDSPDEPDAFLHWMTAPRQQQSGNVEVAGAAQGDRIRVDERTAEDEMERMAAKREADAWWQQRKKNGAISPGVHMQRARTRRSADESHHRRSSLGWPSHRAQHSRAVRSATMRGRPKYTKLEVRHGAVCTTGHDRATYETDQAGSTCWSCFEHSWRSTDEGWFGRACWIERGPRGCQAGTRWCSAGRKR